MTDYMPKIPSFFLSLLRFVPENEKPKDSSFVDEKFDAGKAMNFISSITWVPRGAAKQIPDQVRLEPEDIRKLFESQQNSCVIEPTEEEEEEEHNDDDRASEVEEEWATDEEPDDAKDNDGEPASGGNSFSVSSLSVFPTNDQDPYVAIKDEDDVDSEDEDFKIRPDDNLLAIAHVDEDVSILEVYVYNEKDEDLYCHHDTILPSYPLALEWMPFHPASGEEKGNFVAVASMDAVIQVWDLDLVNAMEPSFELRSKQKKRKRVDKDGSVGNGHTDAVLSLAWNPISEHVLASGSSDQTVVLWDLEEGKPATTLSGFSDKVQSIRWRPNVAEQILCGSCDKTVKLIDCRYLQSKETTWTTEGEVERVLWSSRDNQYFYVATDSGHLSYFDIRQPTQPVSVVKAHGKTITGLCLSSKVPDLLVTCSEDKRIKAWDVGAQNDKPHLVFEKKLKMGDLQFGSMSPDSPFIVALAGEDSDNNFRILDLYKISDEIQKRWGSFLPAELKSKYEPIIKNPSTLPKASRTMPKKHLNVNDRKLDNSGGTQNDLSVPAGEISVSRRSRHKNQWGKREGWKASNNTICDGDLDSNQAPKPASANTNSRKKKKAKKSAKAASTSRKSFSGK